jgi:hypothetical protein
LQSLKAAQKEAAKAYSSIQATAGEAQKAAAPASAPVVAAAPKSAPAPVEKAEVIAEAIKADVPKAEAKKEDAAPKAVEAPKPAAAKPPSVVAAAKPAAKPYTPRPIVVSEETLEDPNVDPKLINYGFSKAPGNLRISNEQAENMPTPTISKPIDFMAIAKKFKKSVDKVGAAPSPR